MRRIEANGRRQAKGTRSLLRKMKASWQLYAILALPVLHVLIFKYAPMYGAQIAFMDYSPAKGFWGSEWVGLKHFIRFVDSYEFARVLRNTVVLSLYQTLVGFPFPIMLALSLNYVNRHVFKKTVQMIAYAPHFISIVVMTGIILQLLAPRTGLINQLIGFLGQNEVNFLGEPGYFKSVVVWSGIWQNVGFSCIIYLAALSAVDPSLHESAVVDGASKLRRMWNIDLPGIAPIAIILLILDIGNTLDTGFEKILLLQNPLNIRTSEVIDTYVYKIGLLSPGTNFSYSSAIGLFKSIVNLMLLIVVNRFSRKVSQTSLW